MLLTEKKQDSAPTVNDPRRVLRAWVLGSLACLLTYGVFGFIFVREHAGFLKLESLLLSENGFPVVISASDPLICATGHQLGAALLFALTLGMLAAVLCFAVIILRWIIRKQIVPDKIDFTMVALVMAAAGFSLEKPLASLAAAVTAPLLFYLIFSRLAGETAARLNLKKTIIIAIFFCAPPVVAGTASYWSVRDAMLEVACLQKVSDFYYDHTLLAADVIKPLKMRTQSAVALPVGNSPVRRIPHGILVVRTTAPDRVAGVRAVFNDAAAANDLLGALLTYSEENDLNRHMRSGIGVALRIMPVFGLLLIIWLVAEFSAARGNWQVLVWLVLFANIGLWSPLVWQKIVVTDLQRNPAKLGSYVESTSGVRRYAASLSDNLAVDDIRRLARDPSPRVRLNALLAAGRRKDPQLINVMIAGLDDPQLNVRTKACWALGQVGGLQACAYLEKTLRDDPSWYVRDYAFSAIGRIRPVRMEVDG